MNKEKLKVKDLVTIGVYAVLYFVVYMATGMVGAVNPFMNLVAPFLCGIIGGILVMLFMAKIPKPKALFIFSAITPIITIFTTGVWQSLVNGIIVSAFAQYFTSKGNYKSVKMNIIATGFVTLTSCGHFLFMLFFKKQYIEMTKATMGIEYAQIYERLMTTPNIILAYAGAFIGGVIGAYIGAKLLKNQFEKAGIV